MMFGYFGQILIINITLFLFFRPFRAVISFF